MNRYEFKISGLNFVYDAKISGTFNECVTQVMQKICPLEDSLCKNNEIYSIILSVEKNMAIFLNIKTKDRNIISYRKMLFHYLYCEKCFSAGEIEKCFVTPKRSCIIKQSLEIKDLLSVDKFFKNEYENFKKLAKL